MEFSLCEPLLLKPIINGPRLQNAFFGGFAFCLCPLCKAWIEVDPRNQLFPMLAKYKETFEKIKDMCIKRLKLEDRMKDEKLVNPSSLYYNKPLDYAIKIYSYYECFKCKSPYFGGLKDCMRGLEDEKNDGWKPDANLN
jgi:E3 ubiquitin-protein ligase MYCBP2